VTGILAAIEEFDILLYGADMPGQGYITCTSQNEQCPAQHWYHLILPKIIHTFSSSQFISRKKRTEIKNREISCISTMYVYNANDFV
jgi:hypothetical protein